jgi:hypothetical protein
VKAESQRVSKGNEIVVFMIRRDSKCEECGSALFDGNLLRMEENRPLCLDCADLGHLEFLPSDNMALTRRATKYSPLRAVVVRWSRTRNRYEHLGILVAPAAIERAEAECLADEDRRARQRERAAVRREAGDREYAAAFTAKLREFYPGCPADEAERIAAWTCRKHSGRVGRSAAAKEFDAQAIRLAIVASIRHEHTRYDELLMRNGDRQSAREAVAADIERVLARWKGAAA